MEPTNSTAGQGAAPSLPTRHVRTEVAVSMVAAVGAFILDAPARIIGAVDFYDEGIALSSATFAAQGQVPYADFHPAYGPGFPYAAWLVRVVFGDSYGGYRVGTAIVRATRRRQRRADGR